MTQDQCLAVMDFSENISLTPQDEIESAHWNMTQVTLHSIHVVKHGAHEVPVLKNEAYITISDDTKHDS